MGKLRESILLWTAFKFVVIPAILIALLSSFFPFIQVMTPVHEGNECVCLYMR